MPNGQVQGPRKTERQSLNLRWRVRALRGGWVEGGRRGAQGHLGESRLIKVHQGWRRGIFKLSGLKPLGWADVWTGLGWREGLVSLRSWIPHAGHSGAWSWWRFL